MDIRLGNDWREFLSLLISHRVKYLVVGAHALAVHGRPRMTGDLDVFVEASETNAHASPPTKAGRSRAIAEKRRRSRS